MDKMAKLFKEKGLVFDNPESNLIPLKLLGESFNIYFCTSVDFSNLSNAINIDIIAKIRSPNDKLPFDEN